MASPTKEKHLLFKEQLSFYKTEPRFSKRGTNVSGRLILLINVYLITLNGDIARLEKY